MAETDTFEAPMHRLSPSGRFLPGVDLAVGDFLRNVYKGFFPRGALDGTGQRMPTANAVIVETFNIPLPAVWPATDPPEAFDPNKLLYLIWLDIVAYTDLAGGTPGPASMDAMITVDAAGAQPTTTPIENVVQDNLGTYSNFAGGFRGRSSIHRMVDEGITQIDVLNYTSLAVFRPGSIPLWTTGNATPWVAGDTRHIYVEVQSNGAEAGVLVLPNHRSNIVIAEFYGDVVETIGLSAVTGMTGPA